MLIVAYFSITDSSNWNANYVCRKMIYLASVSSVLKKTSISITVIILLQF